MPKENLTISASADPITVGEDAVIVVTGFKDATGNVAVSVNGKTYTAVLMVKLILLQLMVIKFLLLFRV